MRKITQVTERDPPMCSLGLMADAAYYRDEARRCRQMAQSARTVAASRRWADLADDYEQLAFLREGRSGALPVPVHLHR